MSEPEAKLGYIGEWPESRLLEDLRFLWAGAGLMAIAVPSARTDVVLAEEGDVMVVTETGMRKLSAQDLR